MSEVKGLAKILARVREFNKKYAADGGGKVVAQVGFTQYYAVYVHENLESRHPVGQAKYLEQPFREYQSELYRIIKVVLQRGQGAIQAVTIAGLRLQREAQLLCPVDTGALKGSAFTRIKEGV